MITTLLTRVALAWGVAAGLQLLLWERVSRFVPMPPKSA